MDDEGRARWIANCILPCEGEIRRWLRQRVKSLRVTDTDDLLQEAYARIWDSDLTKIANPRGYFYVIVRNLLVEQTRRARIVPMERITEIEGLRLASDQPGPEHCESARQDFENLCRIVESLPSKCRDVFSLRSFEGCSRREIAQRLNISERTVEHHLARAFSRIAEAMAEEAGEPRPGLVKFPKSEHDAS